MIRQPHTDRPPPGVFRLPMRPARPRRSGHVMSRTVNDHDNPDAVQRVPCGGGYRILRRPRMLESDD